MLGSVRNIDILYQCTDVFIYLCSPILGRVTATARGANYCRPVTVPFTMRDTPHHRGLRPLLLTNSSGFLKLNQDVFGLADGENINKTKSV